MEHSIDLMYRQHFTHARVMVKNNRTGVTGGIAVSHACLWPAYERRVAEHHPRLLGSGHKSLPERAKHCGRRRGIKMATCDRLSHFTTIAATAAANKTDNASMLADQLSNTCCVRWRFCFSAVALSLSSCALGVICRV